jgi:hypothetical protein
LRQPESKCHDGKRELSSTRPEKGKTLSIVFVGIDLAKNVFAVHAVNDAGKPELVRPNVPRAKRHALFANLPPRTFGMEAGSGAHHWARLFQAHGHTVRLMAPKFVAPYRLSGTAYCPASAHERQDTGPVVAGAGVPNDQLARGNQ